MLEVGQINGSDVCIFEATDRVGGRLYSLRGLGPNKDLTVDAGGAHKNKPVGRFSLSSPLFHSILSGLLALRPASTPRGPAPAARICRGAHLSRPASLSPCGPMHFFFARRSSSDFVQFVVCIP